MNFGPLWPIVSFLRLPTGKAEISNLDEANALLAFFAIRRIIAGRYYGNTHNFFMETLEIHCSFFLFCFSLNR